MVAAIQFDAVKDHLGSVQALTDTNGTVVESYRFDAWGNVLELRGADGVVLESQMASNGLPVPVSSPLGNRYLWQGREYDWQSGYYYFRARWYDPRTGRWLSNDPIGISGGLNQYVFCNNDPVNCSDPFGLWGTDVHLERTRTWVRSIPGYGRNIAERIAQANEATDSIRSGTGPFGAGTGDSTRHFDYDSGSCDSRLTHARNDRKKAIELWRRGRYNDALDLLGQGLHSLQDYYAHRQWDPSLPLAPDWNAHPSWYDNVNDDRNRIPLQQTEQATREYLEYFRNNIQYITQYGVK